MLAADASPTARSTTPSYGPAVSGASDVSAGLTTAELDAIYAGLTDPATNPGPVIGNPNFVYRLGVLNYTPDSFASSRSPAGEPTDDSNGVISGSYCTPSGLYVPVVPSGGATAALSASGPTSGGVTMTPTSSGIATSPTSGTISPTSGTTSPTSGTISPTSGTISPTSGTISPTSGTISPTSGTISPTSTSLPVPSVCVAFPADPNSLATPTYSPTFTSSPTSSPSQTDSNSTKTDRLRAAESVFAYGPATAGAVPIAIGAATIDGPLPIGDAVAGGLLIGAILYDYFCYRKNDLQEVDELIRRVGGATGDERQRIHQEIGELKTGRGEIDPDEIRDAIEDVLGRRPW